MLPGACRFDMTAFRKALFRPAARATRVARMPAAVSEIAAGRAAWHAPPYEVCMQYSRHAAVAQREQRAQKRRKKQQLEVAQMEWAEGARRQQARLFEILP